MKNESKKQICCYKCGSTKSLLIEEKIDDYTKQILEKNFICSKCSGVFQ